MAAAMAAAQPLHYTVRHQHFRGGEEGTLRVTEDSIVFEEHGKHADHSREWKYTDIRQLSLSAAELRILTYESRTWQLGLDREYIFDRLPEDAASRLDPLFARVLDQRFVAQLADTGVRPLWQIEARRRGSQGILIIGEDRIVYQTGARSESRTWRYADIDSIGTGGLFDFSITTLERTGWRHAGPTEFHFELKQALREDRYNDLWRRINRSHILAQNEDPNF
jgi:hypothetical protein